MKDSAALSPVESSAAPADHQPSIDGANCASDLPPPRHAMETSSIPPQTPKVGSEMDEDEEDDGERTISELVYRFVDLTQNVAKYINK